MTPDEQVIRFCTSTDGVRIAYATVGTGPPLVKAANWLSHLEFDWNSPVWRHWLRELSRDHTLVRYDERGCGLSDWGIEDFTLEAWVRDLEAVVEATGLERFPLLGISQGGPIAIAYALRYPERVSHLILYGSFACGLLRRRLTGREAEEAELQLQLVRLGWGKDHTAFRQVFTTLFIPEGTREQFDWFNELQRVSSSPENAARILDGVNTIDVRDLAGRLSVPTLVLHATGDLRIPFAAGRHLASLIPGARLVSLDSRNHILLEPEPAWARFLSEVRGFLGVSGVATSASTPSPPLTVREESRPSPPTMSGERWRRACELFERAAALPPGERAAMLGAACAGDTQLRREVESLLDSDSQGALTRRLDQMLRGSVLSWAGDDETFSDRPLAKYEVIEKLGEGGMGVVYKARDRGLERLAALKLLPRYLSDDTEVKERFMREARAAASLDHPCICAVYEIGEADDGQMFIAMPFYEGETIRQKIDRGPLPLDRALDYAAQIAEGLAHAHEAGIVHRDIKPANVLVTSRGKVKVLDFGIAKVLDVNTTRTGVVLGTVAYMSPEQARGEAVDHRTDLWSLGVVLYEMLTGRQPFAGATSLDLLNAVQHEEPAALRVLRADVPEGVERIVGSLLAKDPAQRFGSADDLLAALREVEPDASLQRGSARWRGLTAPSSAAPRPPTRYAKSADVHIAYQVLGDGPIDLVCVPGWVTNVEHAWEEPSLARFYRRLASFSRLILFDKRGTGLSDQTAELPTLEQRMDDVRAVMEAAGSERAALFGMSEGGNMCVLFAATYPERTIALVTCGVYAKRIWSPEYPWAPTPDERQEFFDAIQQGWGGVVDLDTLAPSVARDKSFRRWWASYLRLSASPRAALALAQTNTQIDVTHILPAVRVPTLVLHRTGDLDVNVGEGRYIAGRIPGAKFVELPGDDHLPWVGDQDAVLDEIERFLSTVHQTPATDHQLATVLYILPGDGAGGETASAANSRHSLEEHRASIRREVEWYKGQVRESDAGAVFATFDGPARAIHCACAIRDGLSEVGLRLGLHTGLCEVTGNRVGGVAVEIAACVAAEAEAGTVLASHMVKDLVSGSGIEFDEGVVRVLHGLTGVWRLFAVSKCAQARICI